MDNEIKERFMEKWDKYFPGAGLPIGFYYTDTEDRKSMPKAPKGHRCMICDLARLQEAGIYVSMSIRLAAAAGGDTSALLKCRCLTSNTSFPTAPQARWRGNDTRNHRSSSGNI